MQGSTTRSASLMPVEGLPFLCQEGQPFDKLRANGGGAAIEPVLNPFDDDRRCHAARRAHGHKPVAPAGAFKFIKHSADQD